MKRAGQRHHSVEVVEPEETSMDAFMQADILKAAGIELDDISEAEKKEIVKAILESSPALLRDIKTKHAKADEASTDTSGGGSTPDRQTQTFLTAGSPIHDSPLAQREDDSDYGIDPDSTQVPDHDVSVSRNEPESGSDENGNRSERRRKRHDSSKEGTDSDGSDDRSRGRRRDEGREESDSDRSDRQRKYERRRDGLIMSQRSSQSTSPQPSTSGLTPRNQRVKHEVEQTRGAHLMGNHSPRNSASSKDDAQLVLDSDDEVGEETQAYDLEENPILAASTEASPLRLNRRSSSGDIVVPESQPQDNSSPNESNEEIDDGDDYVRKTRDCHDSQQLLTDKTVAEEYTEEPEMGKLSKNYKDISLNRIYPKQLKHEKKMLWPCFYTPDQLKDPDRYTQVIKLMFDIYMCRLRRAQLKMNGNLKKWGQPVKTGPHVDGCLLAKRMKESDATQDLEDKGGRALRSRRPGVNEVLMRNARNKCARMDDDGDDFENNASSLSRRPLRTNQRQVQFTDVETHESRREIIPRPNAEGRRSGRGRLGLRNSSEKHRLKSTMDEEDARELFVSDDEVNDVEIDDDEDDWVPPNQKSTTPALARRNRENTGGGAAKKKREIDKKGKETSSWIGKRQKPRVNDNKLKRDEMLDSDEEEIMIQGKRRKQEHALKLSVDKHVDASLGLGLEEVSSDIKSSALPRYKWNDDDEDDDPSFLLRKTRYSRTQPKHTNVVTTKESVSLDRNVRSSVEKEYRSKEEASKEERFNDVVTIDDDSSNEKADLENAGEIQLEGGGGDEDDDILNEEDTRDGKSGAGLQASQRVLSGISSQSSESMLDMHGNLYSTQVAHKAKEKDQSALTGFQGKFLSKEAKKNHEKIKRDVLPTALACDVSGKNERTSHNISSNSEAVEALIIQHKEAESQREVDMEPQTSRRKSNGQGSSRKKVRDIVTADKERTEEAGAKRYARERGMGKKITEKDDDVYHFETESDSMDAPAPENTVGIGKKRKLLSNRAIAGLSSAHTIEEDAHQKKRKVESTKFENLEEESVKPGSKRMNRTGKKVNKEKSVVKKKDSDSDEMSSGSDYQDFPGSSGQHHRTSKQKVAMAQEELHDEPEATRSTDKRDIPKIPVLHSGDHPKETPREQTEGAQKLQDEPHPARTTDKQDLPGTLGQHTRDAEQRQTVTTAQKTRGERQEARATQKEVVNMGECPICNRTFPFTELEAHASSCGEEIEEEDQEQPVRCVYCRKEVTPNQLRDHQANCAQNEEQPPSKRATRSHKD